MSEKHTMPSYLCKLEQENKRLNQNIEILRTMLRERNDRIRRLIKLGLETSEYGLQTHREIWEQEENE